MPGLIERRDGPLQIARQKLIVIVQRLIKFGVALLDRKAMQAGAMDDVRLQPRADQRQIVAGGQALPILPGPIHQQHGLEPLIGLQGQTGGGLIEMIDPHSLVNPQADRHAGIGVLQARVGETGQNPAVGLAIAGVDRQILHR